MFYEKLTDGLHNWKHCSKLPLLYLSQSWGRFSGGQGRIAVGFVQFTEIGGRGGFLSASFLFSSLILRFAIPFGPLWWLFEPSFAWKNVLISICISLSSLAHLSSERRRLLLLLSWFKLYTESFGQDSSRCLIDNAISPRSLIYTL